MKRLLRLATAGCLVFALGGCEPLADDQQASGGEKDVIVGSANFPENELIAGLYAGALRARGIDVSTRFNVGSRETLLPALERGDINVLPEYTGSLLAFVSDAKDLPRDTAGQLKALDEALPAGMRVLKPSAAQDQNTITCSGAVAREHGLRTLEDLAKVSRSLTIGGPPELAKRDGFGSLKGLKDVYGVEFKEFRPLDTSGPLTVSALQAGKVDCANLFSTQPAIVVNGFVSLDDPKSFTPSEAVVPLIADDVADPEVTAALDAVSAALTTEDLKQMLKRVVVDKDDAVDIADEFLREKGLD